MNVPENKTEDIIDQAYEQYEEEVAQQVDDAWAEYDDDAS